MKPRHFSSTAVRARIALAVSSVALCHAALAADPVKIGVPVGLSGANSVVAPSVVQAQPGYGGEKAVEHDPPILYHLGNDPSERFDVAKEHADVIADIKKEAAVHRANMKFGENQLEKVIPKK